MMIPPIPDDAPFTPAQRAWLAGFFAGLFGATASPAPAQAEDFPWHDPALDLPERLALAEGRPLARRLMAAMAQLDCGQCGHQCQSYAEALAEGRETSTALCVPGARPTARMLKQLLAATPAAAAAPPPAAAAPEGVRVRVVSAEPLTLPGSAKDVRHVAIDLAGSGLRYEPGDSIAIAVQSDPALVAATLAALRATGAEPAGEGRDLRTALSERDIARPLDRVFDLLATAATDAREAATLRRLAAGEDGVEPEAADLLDLLEAFPSARPKLADLAQALPPLRRRLYSIASAPSAHGEALHLCVGMVRDSRRGRVRLGVGSGLLARHAAAAGDILASIQTSHLRPPADPRTPIVMIGPGTGIAPFRGFLADRAARGAPGSEWGPAWLFFGDQHRATDYLYGTELEAWRAGGVLARLDLAFSRDQAQKLYVQHRMIEHGAALWRWLQDGAHVYVCGDASRMARDVDAALRRIAMAPGGLDEDRARDWIAALARQGRYERDIY